MKKALFALAIIVVLLIGFTEASLPGYYEEQIEAGFRREVEALDNLTVEIVSRPALLLLTGRVHRGSILAQGVGLEGLRIAEIDARYRDLHIAQTPEGVRAASGVNTYFRAEFTAEDLNRYLQARYSEFDSLYLDINPDELMLNLQVAVFNTPVLLQLRGSFTIPNDHTIRFVLEGLDVAKISVPTSLITRLLQGIEFDLELEQFPLPLDLKEIRLEQDILIVLGGTG